MGEIFVAVVKVQGDSDTINQALRMASDVIAQRSAPAAVEIPQAPMPALPAAPVKKVAGKFYCKQCTETFDSVGKVSAHTRMTHPKKAKVSAVATPATKTPADLEGGPGADGKFWGPQKNCGAVFSKVGWRNQHMQRAHGITL